MHSRDATVLIDLLWFNVAHYSSLSQYFFSIYYGPYSSWKFLIFSVLVSNKGWHNIKTANYNVSKGNWK